MNRQDDDRDLLDRVVSEMRNETIEPRIVEAAADRVWKRIAKALPGSAQEGPSAARWSASPGDAARSLGMESTDARFPTAGAEGRLSSPEGSLAAAPRLSSPEVSLAAAADAESGGGGAAGTGRAESIRGCAGFEALIPAYLGRTLAPARALLLEDHLRGCVVCRRELSSARSAATGKGSSTMPFPTEAVQTRARGEGGPLTRRPWALAAAASIGIALLGLGVWQRLRPVSAGQAQVQSLQGTLYRITATGNVPVAEGAVVGYGEEILTTKGSGAVVRLGDGSLIEMDERSAIRLNQAQRDTTIRLPRGNIIVQAAKRRSGHLYVASDDALVSVTGTIFSVSHGTKGSRVSVIEGEVRVDHDGTEAVLRPGDQLSTHTSLAKVPVAHDIAWSRDVDRYVALLGEMAAIRKELDGTVLTPYLRHSTALLDAMPPRTVIYAAIPNVTHALDEVDRRIRDHVQQSEVLREWWEGGGNEPNVQEIFDKIRLFGNHLGDEIVLSMQVDTGGDLLGLVLMSELERPEEFKAMLAGEVRKVNVASRGGPALRILPEDLDEAPAGGATGKMPPGPPSELLLWVHGGRLVAATSVPLVREVSSIMETPETNSFRGSSFHARIADSYREGAGWLFCADVRALMGAVAAKDADARGSVRGMKVLQGTGLLDVQHFVLDVKESAERTDTHAVLSFDKPRTGMASWLAPPAPMGALTFMSPDTNLLAAFVVKEPLELVEELFTILGAGNPAFADHLTEFEAESGLNIREDLAAPLGGELAVALDGPVLPMPSWKVVFEVYDPERLQRTIEKMIARIDQSPAEAGQSGPTLGSEVVSGRTFHVMRSQHPPLEVHYVFVDGYLVAAPSRGLLERAIQSHESGYVLSSSGTFKDLLPDDGRVNFSAIVYQNFGSVLGPLAQNLAGSSGLTPEQRQSVAVLGEQARARMGCAYAEKDRIVFASSGKGSLTANLGGMFLIDGGEQGISRLFEQAMKPQAAGSGESAGPSR